MLRGLLGINCTQAATRDGLRACLEGICRRSKITDVPLLRNSAALTRLLGLSSLESRILAFGVIAVAHPGMAIVSGVLGPCSNSRLFGVIAAAVGGSLKDVYTALAPQGGLARNLLIQVESGYYSLEHKFSLQEDLSDVLIREHAEPCDLLRPFFDVLESGELGIGDFPHLLKEAQFILSFLRGARRERLPGVNILLYGETGTGKTEFARALAKATRAPLYAVANRDSADASPSRNERFLSYLMCMRFLAQRNKALVLFDEMEDALPVNEANRVALSKAWMNRQLEGNPVPTIWIANTVDHVDPAFLRRFDFAVRFVAPPTHVREAMLRKHIEAVASDTELQKVTARLAGLPGLTPANAAKAARVMRVLGKSKLNRVDAVYTAIASSMALIGAIPQIASSVVQFRNECINPDGPLSALEQGVAERRYPGPILIFGPPGSGKTSYAMRLAKLADLELQQLTELDLLGSGFGDPSADVRRLFRELHQRDAALLIDNLQALVAPPQERHGHNAALETLVDEMSRFTGLIVCCTNRSEYFAEGVLRHFTVKVKLGYLTLAQRQALFAELSADEKLDVITKHRLDSLTNLTVGDFELMRRIKRHVGAGWSAGYLLEALSRESSLKQGVSGSIGFLARDVVLPAANARRYATG
jgi:transitional endoplasmic reticulum ATPase